MHPLAETGRVIAGRYRLEAPIGRGAMGVVWRARDQLLDREVAVKEVQIADSLTEEERTNAYQRTLREAKTAARLSHPGVVTVYDVAEDGGRPWIVMELINSQSLDRVLGGSGPLSPRRAAAMGRQLLSALSVAHAAGVLHRDVKPSNVLLGNDDRAVLTDFGIATFQGDPKLTQTGMVMGSPGFTAPERIRGGAASPASDLWSLGATIYAAVQGHGPYEQRGGAITTMSAIINEDAPSAPSAGALGRVIDSLLRREPDDRPDAATASRMIADILHLLPDKSTVTTDGYETTALSAASPPRAAASAQTSLDAAAPAVAAVAGQAADEPADRAGGRVASEPPEPVGAASPLVAAGLASGTDIPAGANLAADRPCDRSSEADRAIEEEVMAASAGTRTPAGSSAAGSSIAGSSAGAAFDSPEPVYNLGSGFPAPSGYDSAPRYDAPSGYPAHQPSAGQRPAGQPGQVPGAGSGREGAAWAPQPPPDFSSWYGPSRSGASSRHEASPRSGASSRSGAASPSGAVAGPELREAPGTRPRRSGIVWKAALLALAVVGAVAGAATFLLIGKDHHTPQSRPTAAPVVLRPKPADLVTAINQPAPVPAPPGYMPYTSAAPAGSAAGFKIEVPSTWNPIRNGKYETFFRDPVSGAYLLVDLTPHTFLDNMLREEKYIAMRAQGSYTDYTLDQLQRTNVRGTAGAFWKFTYLKNGVETQVLDMVFTLNTPGGPQSYALLASGPYATWTTTLRPIFDEEFRSFAPLP